MVAGALAPQRALRAVGRQLLSESWRLEGGAGYLTLAPLHALLDHMTLLTIPQHVALLLTVGACGAAVGAARANATGPRLSRGWTRARQRSSAAVAGCAVALVATLALCLWGALAPRPMMRLAGTGPDDLVIDFHAHTEASHDARAGWDRNRLVEWLASAGFDAAYVTDHATLWPTDWARTHDIPQSSSAVRLLPGIEVRGMGQHLNILGVTTGDMALFWDGSTRVQLDSLAVAMRTRSFPPVVMVTSPMTDGEPLHRGVVHAVEMADAAPRAIAFTHRHRALLRQLADSQHLVPLSGSDLHGWGRTAAAWTVLQIPGWRMLPLDALDRRIRARLLAPDGANAIILERPPLPWTGSGWEVPFTVPLLAYAVVSHLSLRERMVWLVWAWGYWLSLVVARRVVRWRARARLLRAIRGRRDQERVLAA